MRPRALSVGDTGMSSHVVPEMGYASGPEALVIE